MADVAAGERVRLALRSMFGRAAVAALLVTAVAACSGASSKTATQSTTSASTSSATTTTVDVAADKAKAEASLLTLQDLPAGWTSSGAPSTSRANDQALDQSMADCLGVPVSEMNPSGGAADSPDFSSPDGLQFRDTVSLSRDEATARRIVEIFSRPEMTSCMANAMDDVVQKEMAAQAGGSLPPGVTLGKAVVTKVDFPALGDETLAFHAAIPLTMQGANVDFGVDSVMIRKGRVGSILTMIGLGHSFPSDLAAQLATAAAGRMQA